MLEIKPNLKEGEDYMIVDDKIWQYVSERYSSKNDLVRFGIKVNDTTGECIVEVYLKRIQISPIPNATLFKVNGPKAVIISRKETIEDLVKKI